MRLKNAPYWALAVVLTPFTPIARFIIKRGWWPYNEGGPLDRSDPREGTMVMDAVGEPHPFDDEFCGPECQPVPVACLNCGTQLAPSNRDGFRFHVTGTFACPPFDADGASIAGTVAAPNPPVREDGT